MDVASIFEKASTGYSKGFLKFVEYIVWLLISLYALQKTGITQLVPGIDKYLILDKYISAITLVALVAVLNAISRLEAKTTFGDFNGSLDVALSDYVRTHRTHHTAEILHFPGVVVQQLVYFLLRENCDVHLYLADPAFIRPLSSGQANRIESSVEDYKKIKQMHSGNGKFTMHLCSTWPVMRAIILDRRLICVGWYPMIGIPPLNNLDVIGAPEILLRQGEEGFDNMLNFLDKYKKGLRPSSNVFETASSD